MSFWKKLFGSAPASVEDSITDHSPGQDGLQLAIPSGQFHHVFVKRDLVVIPTVSRATSGLFLDTEPVVALPLSDPEAIRATLTALVARGNPEIPLPARGEYQETVTRHARVRNWAELNRKFAGLGFTCEGSEFRLDFMAPGAEDNDPAKMKRVPTAEIVDAVLREIQALQDAV